MPTITIDGRELHFEGDKTILQVAIENGIEIPHYCYHAGLSVVASCRICQAEVSQGKAPGPATSFKLVPTCQAPAMDGAVVNTRSPKVIANQKAVMEYLLINHPLDCPVCDQAGECLLQDYSYRYGRSESRFAEAKIKQPKKDIGAHVLLYSDRCIMCSRCVRFCREVTGTGELGVFGRGSGEQIDIFPGKPLDNELSGNVVDICPVGALLDKDFLMSVRVWDLELTPGIDGLTCSGDNIMIEHHNGRIYRFKPRTNMEINKWWISDEIRYSWKHIYSDNRLHEPLVKMEGDWEKLDWERAYRQIVSRLRESVATSGTGAVGVLISPMLTSEEAYLLGKFIIGLDDEAVIGIGPVPVEGQDKHFPGGYTLYAEKCPNCRGVDRALRQIAGEVLDYKSFIARLSESDCRVSSMVVTGNYPVDWPDDELVNACRDRYCIVMDILPTRLEIASDLVLPTAVWVEKEGSFENVQGRLQSFPSAIDPPDNVRCEGQIALDLMHVAGHGRACHYQAKMVRYELGDAFATDIRYPAAKPGPKAEIEYIPL